MMIFLLVAALCALVQALATLVTEWIWRQIPASDTFEKMIEVANNPHELAFCNIVLLEMFFILVAQLGLATLAWQASPPLAILGMIFFSFFIITELLYRSVELFAVKRVWIPGYQQQPNEALRIMISGFNDTVEALYFVLLMGNGLGSALIGLALCLLGGWALLAAIVLFVNACRVTLRVLEMHVGWRGLSTLNRRFYGPLSVSISLALALSLAIESHIFF